MIQKFTTPCFIRKNTHELREKLEKLGYIRADNGAGVWYIPMCQLEYLGVNLYSAGRYMGINGMWSDSWIDCGTNEALFLGLAALREDTDKGQWFCDNDFNWEKRFFICRYDTIKEHINKVTDGDSGSYKDYHKATVEELIEHFKTKNDDNIN